MNVTITAGKLSGTIKAPPSKSMAHRMLICEGLCKNQVCRIHGISDSDDISATLECLSSLGAKYQKDGDIVTITGTDHYHGDGFLKKDTRVLLIKDPDNKYDHEAIRVEMEGLGKIGYVANSCHTVLGDSFSAGRLYDQIGDKAVAKVKHVLPRGVICSVRQKDLLWWPPQEHAHNDEAAL